MVKFMFRSKPEYLRLVISPSCSLEVESSLLFRLLMGKHDLCGWDILPSLVWTCHVLTAWTRNQMRILFLIFPPTTWSVDSVVVRQYLASVNSLNSPLGSRHRCFGTFADTSARAGRRLLAKTARSTGRNKSPTSLHSLFQLCWTSGDPKESKRSQEYRRRAEQFMHDLSFIAGLIYTWHPGDAFRGCVPLKCVMELQLYLPYYD